MREVKLSNEQIKSVVVNSLRNEAGRVEADWEYIQDYEDSVGINDYYIRIKYKHPTPYPEHNQ